MLEGLLEDRLLDEPEALHFALQPHVRSPGTAWVATCERAWLASHLQALDEAGMGGTYWAAGIFWGDKYALTLQPAEKFTVDRPQMQVLMKHLAPKTAAAAESPIQK